MDNKAILYFEAPSTSDALTWFRGDILSLLVKGKNCSQGLSCSDQPAHTRVEGVTVLYLDSLILSRLCANMPLGRTLIICFRATVSATALSSARRIYTLLHCIPASSPCLVSFATLDIPHIHPLISRAVPSHYYYSTISSMGRQLSDNCIYASESTSTDIECCSNCPTMSEK